MNVGIERAFYITSQYIKDHGEDTDYAYVFALFSAALLLDVGRVDYRRNIMICNKNGVFLKEWQPLICGGLFVEGDFFKVRESVNYSERLINTITPLLAQKIVEYVAKKYQFDLWQIDWVWYDIVHKRDLRKPPKYWLIIPGSDNDKKEEFLRDNYIEIGYMGLFLPKYFEYLAHLIYL